MKFPQIHVADPFAEFQLIIFGKKAYAFLKKGDGFPECLFTLFYHAQSQVGAVIGCIAKGSSVKVFGSFFLVRDRFDFRIVPVAEGHGQPGEKIGV